MASPLASLSPLAQRLALPALAVVLLAPFVPFLVSPSAHVIGASACDNPSMFYFLPHFAGHAWRSGTVPLWNPYVMCGIPFAGEGQGAIFHPLSALFVFLPTGLAYNCVATACFVLSGLFFYGFIRALGLGRAAAACSALAWAFSTAQISRLYAGHLTIQLGLPILPLLPMLWERWRARGEAWCLPALAAGYGCLQLAGYPQATYSVSLFFLFYVLLSSSPEWRTASGRRTEARAIAALGCFVVLGIGLGAVQLLPSTDYAGESFRRQSSLEFCGSFSFAPENLITLIAPGFFGTLGTSGTGQYWGRNYLWEMWMYFGILPLVLAAVGAVAAPRRRRWVLLGCAAVAFVVALGRHTPLFPLLYRFVPFFDTFRGPSKYGVITLFCLTALSAYGFDALLAPRASEATGTGESAPSAARKRHGSRQPEPGRSAHKKLPPPRRRDPVLVAGLAASGVIVAVSALLAAVLLPGHASAGSTWQGLLRWVQVQGESYVQPLNVLDPAVLQATARPAGAWLARGAALAILSAGLLLLARRRHLGRPALLAATLALLAFDLGTFFAPCLVSYDERITRYPQSLLDALEPRNTLPTRILDPTSYQNEAMRYGLSSIGGYSGNTLTRYNNFLNHSQGMDPTISQAATTIRSLPESFRMLGLETIVLPPKIPASPEWRPVAEMPDGRRVLRFPGCPRVFLAVDAHRCASADEALDYVLGEKADPVARPAVETDGALPEAAPLEPGEEAACTEFGLNRVALRVHAARPRLLVLTEMLYKDWRVRANGASAPILPANYLFRGVLVPEGDSTVVFTYESRAFRAGLVITLAALAILAVAAWGMRSRGRLRASETKRETWEKSPEGKTRPQ